MTPARDPEGCRLCIVGVGNTIAGDDGAGNAVVSRLMEKYGGREDLLLHNLETDPLELWDILPAGKRFIFVDAVAGSPPGKLVAVGKGSARGAWSPSLHQMDLPTVIRYLSELRSIEGLEWEIWGITIDFPEKLSVGLSPAVFEAVETLVRVLSKRIEAGNCSVIAPKHFLRFPDDL